MNEKRLHLENIIDQIDALAPDLATLDRLCADRESQAEVVTLIKQALNVAQASANALIQNIAMSEDDK